MIARDAHLAVLSLRRCRLRHPVEPAVNAIRLVATLLDLTQSVVAGHMFLSDGFTAVGAGDAVAADLGGVSVGGILEFNPWLEHSTTPQRRLNVDGLVYSGLPNGTSTREWLRLLREGMPYYAAQPYQQLAAAHRAAGHDGEVRRILMAQRRDQVDRRALTGRAERGGRG